MSFRTRVAAAAAFVVAMAVLLACFAAYKEARDALVGSADSSLSSAYEHVYSNNPPAIDLDRAPGFGVLLVGQDGKAIFPSYGIGSLPIDQTIKDVASGQAHAEFRTVNTPHDGAVRELIAPVASGTLLEGGHYFVNAQAALVLVEPFQGVQTRLGSLGDGLVVLAALGILVAALFGYLAARAALVPLAETTKDIEDVAATLDVSVRVDEGSNDELGRLRRAFNKLLEELELSQDAQRQLILDASHELRTPLTSLRANAQVLSRLDELGDDDVSQLSDDMVTQVDELTRLVGDLTELTRGEHSVEEVADLDLGELVGECVEVAETHARTKHVSIELTSEVSYVRAKRNRLVRAVGNLIDNAVKFCPDGSTVVVTCREGTVGVEDAGPGIDEADRPFVFDRFFRSPRDRGRPGSGLGLAIVAQVAQEAGGTVSVGTSSTLGGARMELRLPVIPAGASTA